MIHISEIYIDGFHNLQDFNLQFNQVSYIYGDNGAGKSSILQAIQWAILGYIPGTSKRKSDIFKHAKNNQMRVKVILSDGAYIERSLIRSGTNIDETCNISPGLDIDKLVSSIELPVWNFTEFISMSANKLKDWFIEYLPDNTIQLDWAKELNAVCDTIDMPIDREHITNLISSIVDVSKETTDVSIEDVRKVNATCKDKLKFERESLEMLTSTVRTLVQVDPPNIDLTEEEIAEHISELIHQQQDRIHLESIISQNETIEQELSELAGNVSTWKQQQKEFPVTLENFRVQYDKIQSKLYSINTDIVSENAKMQNLNSLLSTSDEEGICPYTKNKCGDLSQIAAETKSNLDACVQKLKEKTTVKEKLVTQQAQVSKDIDTYSKLLEDVNSRLRRYEDLTKMRIQVDEGALESMPTREEISHKLAEYQEYSAQLQAYKYYNNEISAFTAKKVEIMSDIEIWKAWVKFTDVNGLQERIISQKSPFDALVENMNVQYIHAIFGDNSSVQFQSESGKSCSFGFGIYKDGHFISYDLLSSGEKCIFTIALLIELLKTSDATIGTLIVDDILDHLDASRFRTLLHIISAENIQLLLAGVKLISDDENLNIQQICIADGHIKEE